MGQGSSAGGISGMSSTNGQRPTMTQTANGKNFPYSMHRKIPSNKMHPMGSNLTGNAG